MTPLNHHCTITSSSHHLHHIILASPSPHCPCISFNTTSSSHHFHQTVRAVPSSGLRHTCDHASSPCIITMHHHHASSLQAAAAPLGADSEGDSLDARARISTIFHEPAVLLSPWLCRAAHPIPSQHGCTSHHIPGLHIPSHLSMAHLPCSPRR